MIDEEDPEELLFDIKDYNICEDCGKKTKPDFKKCYDCFMEGKKVK